MGYLAPRLAAIAFGLFLVWLGPRVPRTLVNPFDTSGPGSERASVGWRVFTIILGIAIALDGAIGTVMFLLNR
jgi:hypothetical protein